jgi:cobalamin biosynthesis Mg chelatase CobN
MSAYQQTVPGLMCRTWYGQCIAASGEDAAQQFACNQARDTQCGNLTTSDATDAGNGVAPSGSSSSGSSSSPTSSGAMSSSTESAASSASSAAPASGAANLAMYGSSALVGGLLAVFGLAL